MGSGCLLQSQRASAPFCSPSGLQSLVSRWVSALILAGQLSLGCTEIQAVSLCSAPVLLFSVLLSACANSVSGALLAATICCVSDTLAEKQRNPRDLKSLTEQNTGAFFYLSLFRLLQHFPLSVLKTKNILVTMNEGELRRSLMQLQPVKPLWIHTLTDSRTQ